MASVTFITHPDVAIDPVIPVPDWCLNPTGIARMRSMLTQCWVGSLAYVASSAERKARDGADILAAHLGLAASVHADLGENDRSATGYMPKPAFEALVDAFFANPTDSVQGWERAVDAQARIVSAMRAVLASAPPGDVAVVSHGGVGALLLCHLRQSPISQAADQPPGNGGYFLTFDRASWRLQTAWQRIDP
ncbi:MAG: histidine phosphatase family protein [Acetobacteraceae bacterium]|nr:histidine phosphatase family protein [Acetobacteraceae bacterium]